MKETIMKKTKVKVKASKELTEELEALGLVEADLEKSGETENEDTNRNDREGSIVDNDGSDKKDC